MLVVVTGAAGQLGRALQLTDPGSHRVRYLGRDDCDVTDAWAVASCAALRGADVVVNCAAFTGVDAAEDPPGRALAGAVNARAPELLSRRCAREGAHLVQVSTDYVFGDVGAGEPGEPGESGQQGPRAPIPACATPHPLGVYGKTKLAGEQAVLRGPAPATVVRTAWLYTGELVAEATDFVSTMLRLARTGVDPKVVDDQFGSPTYAADLARALWGLCDSLAAPGPAPAAATNAAPGPGPARRVLHGVGNGQASWFELAREVFRAAGHDPARVTPVPTSGYPTRARRPTWSVLASDLTLPEWRGGVRRAVAGRL